jgi:hypothetical protein
VWKIGRLQWRHFAFAWAFSIVLYLSLDEAVKTLFTVLVLHLASSVACASGSTRRRTHP